MVGAIAMDCTGFLIMYKPAGISSYDVIRHIKRIFKRRLRIGHAGTLDPIADGLLIIAIGRTATRELSVFGKLPKCYKATGTLGILTDSLDKEGQLLAQKDPSLITRQQIDKAISLLGDSYLQIPPVYAAVKYEGVPLYEHARTKLLPLEALQKIACQKARLVNLYSLSLIDFQNPLFTVDMSVSQGTYVRSVLNDIAHKVDNYATTQTLTRYSVGSITLKDAIKLEDLHTLEDVCERMVSKEQMQQRFGITFIY